jgi:hypothetical protein
LDKRFYCSPGSYLSENSCCSISNKFRFGTQSLDEGCYYRGSYFSRTSAAPSRTFIDLSFKRRIRIGIRIITADGSIFAILSAAVSQASSPPAMS